MTENINVVTISTGVYNQIKNDNFKYNLFLDNILQNAYLSDDHQGLVFDSKLIEESMKFCFYERYKKKKIATLKTQFARYGNQAVINETERNG